MNVLLLKALVYYYYMISVCVKLMEEIQLPRLIMETHLVQADRKENHSHQIHFRLSFVWSK